MKNKGYIHILHALMAVWLIAVVALIVTACGPRQDPCPVCGATYVCDCAVVETVVTQEPCEVCGSTELCDCAPPIVEETAAHGD